MLVSLLSVEQRHGRAANSFSPSFVLSRGRALEEDERRNESFMSDLYHRFYADLQQRWHIDLPIIDYNLARLKKLAEQHQFRFTVDDFPLALEFFLQMDGQLLTSGRLLCTSMSSRSIPLEDGFLSWSLATAPGRHLR